MHLDDAGIVDWFGRAISPRCYIRVMSIIGQFEATPLIVVVDTIHHMPMTPVLIFSFHAEENGKI